MAEKKLLTYEGLEEYNIKWHERLQAMVIEDDEVDDIFMNEMMRGYTWTYKFDTTLTTTPYASYTYSDGTKDYSAWWRTSGVDYQFNEAGIPFWCPQGKSITVDWGDGSIETITGTKSIDSFDTHSTPGHTIFHSYQNSTQTYTISITSDDWNSIWLCCGDPGNAFYYISGYGNHWFKHSNTRANEIYNMGEYIYQNCSDSYNFGFSETDGFCGDIRSQVAAMRMGCIEISKPLPHLAGVIQCDDILIDGYTSKTYNGQTPTEWFADLPEAGTFLPHSMYYALGWYNMLRSAPSNLFAYNLDATDFTGCIWGVSSNLASTIEYPTNLAQPIVSVNNYTN